MQGFSFNNIVKVLPLLFLLLLIPLLTSNSNLDQGLLIRFLGLQLVISFLLITSIIYNFNKPLIFNSALLYISFAFTVYGCFHLLWGNIYSDSIFDWLKNGSFFLLLFYIVQSYSYRELRVSIPFFISVLGIILTSLGIIELINVLLVEKLSIPLSTYQIKTVFGHRNLYSQILFLSFPFQIYQFLTVKNRVVKITHIVFAFCTFFLLIVLSNRASWLALISGFVLVTVLYLWLKRKSINIPLINRRNFKTIVLSLIISLSLSGLFFSYFTKPSEAKNHFSNIIKADNGSVKDRIGLWERSINIIKEEPFFGCGAANWKIEMLKYGSKGLVSDNNITFYQRPHNDFLWIFSEFGIVGGILYSLVFLVAFVLIISQIKKEKQKQNLLFQYVILFALSGFLVFSLLSFPHERIVHNIMLSTFFAIIIANNFNDKSTTFVNKNRILKILVYSISIIIIGVSTVFGYQRFKSEAYTKYALMAKMKGQHSNVILNINKANTPFYQMDPLSTPLSWYEGLAWYQLGQTDSAVKYLHKAYEINPYHVHVLNNLASAYAQKGETAKAIATYNKAIKIYPEFEEGILNLCAVYYNMGQYDSAFMALTNININSPNPQYKSFLKYVLKSKFTDILKKQGKNNLIMLLPDDDEWYFRQYKTSVKYNIPINSINFDSIIGTTNNN